MLIMSTISNSDFDFPSTLYISIHTIYTILSKGLMTSDKNNMFLSVSIKVINYSELADKTSQEREILFWSCWHAIPSFIFFIYLSIGPDSTTYILGSSCGAIQTSRIDPTSFSCNEKCNSKDGLPRMDYWVNVHLPTKKGC